MRGFKEGIRVLGFAESHTRSSGVLCGVVMRGDMVIDGVSFSSIEVGGLDASETITGVFHELNRDDINAVLVSGVAIAWFNMVDIESVYDELGLPVISVTYENSDGLEETIEKEFTGREAGVRLDLYDSFPPRHRIELAGGYEVFFRAMGCEVDWAADLLRFFSDSGGRPEPVRVARLISNAALSWSE